MKEFNLPVPAADALDSYQNIQKRITVIAADLAAAARKNRALVVCGRRQPPAVHAIVHALNDALGAVGHTLTYTQAHESPAGQLGDLVKEMKFGKVTALVMAGVNPAYDAPADFAFADALKSVPETIHLGLRLDETGRLSKWHLPMSHDLESWGDARAHDGTVSLFQPLIFPLYASKSAVEFLSIWNQSAAPADAGTSPAPSADTAAAPPPAAPAPDVRLLLQTFWSARIPKLANAAAWRKVVHDGIIAESAYPLIQPAVRSGAVVQSMASVTPASSGIEIVFAPDARVYDGRFANNAWLQECPDPITKITWDNPALIGTATAASLGIENEDEIEITNAGRSLVIGVWIVPGIADNSITLTLGGGRASAGQVGAGAGFNTYTIRDSAAPYFAAGGSVRKTGRKIAIARAQSHDLMEGRPILRHGTQEEYRKNPEFAREMVKTENMESLFEERKYDQGNQWAMSIDLSLCTGCNACVVACQSENNVPVVGKEQVIMSREMQWMRIDRYVEEVDGDPVAMSQPMPCQHCENAPCEQVCPAAATSHTTEGLNDIVYNRCIGTRYCENNCPYKIRRFNYFNWTGSDDLIQRGFIKELMERRIYRNDPNGTIKMAYNPDVTVRGRGVMEKCTFCVQRLTRAKIEAKAQGRETVEDGEAVSACAQVCPAGAIVFGNQNDPASRVAKLRNLDRGYEVLGELNVRPRVTYQARLRNPNPQWV